MLRQCPAQAAATEPPQGDERGEGEHTIEVPRRRFARDIQGRFGGHGWNLPHAGQGRFCDERGVLEPAGACGVHGSASNRR